jgi:hypothetical protein
MIQSGDGDWIINSIPTGNESGALLRALAHRDGSLEEDREFFAWQVPFDWFRAVSSLEVLPAKQEIFSLCPLCASGENTILDKTGLL